MDENNSSVYGYQSCGVSYGAIKLRPPVTTVICTSVTSLPMVH